MLPEDLQDYQGLIENILRNNDKKVYDMDLLKIMGVSPEHVSAIEVELAIAEILRLEHVMVAEINPKFSEKLIWDPKQNCWDGFPPERQDYQDLVEVVIAKYSEVGVKQPAFDKIRFEDIQLPMDDLTLSKQAWSFWRDIGAIKDVRVHFSWDKLHCEYKIMVDLTLSKQAWSFWRDIGAIKDVRVHFSWDKLHCEYKIMVDLTLSKQAWSFWRDIGAIKDVILHFSCDKLHCKYKIRALLEQIKSFLTEDPEFKSILARNQDRNTSESRIITDVMEILEKAAGKIKPLPRIAVHYIPLSDYYKNDQFPPELEDFNDHGFGSMLEIGEEETSRFDWGSFIVAILGLLQITAGICLSVMSGSVGIFFGACLFNEGINDVMYAIQSGLIDRNFSWKDYGINKVRSVSLSIIFGGVINHFKSAQTVGNIIFTKLKSAVKDALKQGGKAVLPYFLNLGFDRMLKNICKTITLKCRASLDSFLKSENKCLIIEMNEVLSQIQALSHENDQVDSLINGTFEHVFQNQKNCNFGRSVIDKAYEISRTVINILGNSSNTLLEKLSTVGHFLNTNKLMTAIEQPLLDLAQSAKVILMLLIRNLKTTLTNLQVQRVNNPRNPKDSSPEGVVGKCKENSCHNSIAKISDFMATTIKDQFQQPTFIYSARSVVNSLNAKMRGVTNSLRDLNTKTSTAILKQFQLERQQEIKIPVYSKIKGRTTITELDPDTLLEGSHSTVRTIANLFGDSAVFDKDYKGKIHNGNPTFADVVQNFGQGKSVSLVELFVCACYFDFILTIEDATGELNFEEDKIKIVPGACASSKRSAESEFISANLVYMRNDKNEALVRPMYEGEVQEFGVASEISRLGLYQSLEFLKRVLTVQDGVDVKMYKRREIMKQACDAPNVEILIDAVKQFAESNLKGVDIVQHFYEQMSLQGSVGNGSEITIESIQKFSLDGIEDLEGGYGNGHILRKIQTDNLTKRSLFDSITKNEMEF
ncbi:unnamed protein product [Allacma fusca]|uniref:Uncharacterized protein n=1 Tax=Allacma fusca TaxID=39272 RepID=A0A8J2JDY9_9HEXA|nr:unnamed protein product [Allacma fusca]